MVERLIEVYNHQEVIPVSEELLSDLGLLAKKALPLAIEVKIEGDRCVLPELVELEFSLVDNETIAKVHDDFMEIPSATDVITFDHGEVIIGLEVARDQSAEFGDVFEREVGRYIVHGLLHLAGYFDDTVSRAAHMEKQQELILEKLWAHGLDSSCLR